MRTTLLLALFLPLASVAQTPRTVEAQRDARAFAELGENAVLYLGGITTAFIVGGATAGAVGGEIPVEAAVPLVYAAGAAGLGLGVHGAARILGIEGTLGNALGDAMRGAALGALAGGLTYAAIDGMTGGGQRLEALFFAGAVTVLVPVTWVIGDYRTTTPTVLRGPDGERAPGLSFAIGL